MNERDKAIDRYRKLRSLARDQAGQPEGDTALGFARRLAEKWEITPEDIEAAVAASGPGIDLPGAVVHLSGREAERYREHYRAVLLAVIAELAGCKAGYNAETWDGKIYGAEDVAGEIAAVYTELTTHMEAKFHQWWLKNRYGFTPRATAARAFWNQIAKGIQEYGRDTTRIVRARTVEPDSVRLARAQATRLDGEDNDPHLFSGAREVKGVPTVLMNRIELLRRWGAR